MFLAGIQLHEGVVLLELTRRVRNAGFDGTADKLGRAWADDDQTVPLETDDLEALLRVLADGPDKLADLRSALLKEQKRRPAGGH